MSDLLQEDRGLIEVHKACVEMRAIWRPTSCHDLGVDGQIEFLEITDTVISTGQIIATQVKSGPSYFKEQTDSCVKYYPSQKHLRYWQSLNLPIILVLHNPVTNQTIFTEVKSQLGSGSSILVPLESRFNCSARPNILSLCDRIDDPQKVLNKLRSVTLTTGANTQVSGIEFLLSCLNPSHEYFELRMARITVMLEMSNEEGLNRTDSMTHDFIHRCSLICLDAKISESFAEIYDHHWYDLYKIPDFVVALTPFGNRVADYLVANANEFVSIEGFLHHNVGDAKNIALFIERLCQKESELMDAWSEKSLLGY